MDDPKLMTALGAPWGLPIPTESAAVREFLYIRMWTTFLAGNFAIGEITESEVHYIAANEILGSQAGRAYWVAVGKAQVNYSTGRRQRFYRILDEEYRKIIAGNVPAAEPINESTSLETKSIYSPHAPKSMRQDQVERLGIAAFAVIIGAIADRAWQRSSTRAKRQGRSDQ